jgi:hypothetical protein
MIYLVHPSLAFALFVQLSSLFCRLFVNAGLMCAVVKYNTSGCIMLLLSFLGCYCTHISSKTSTFAVTVVTVMLSNITFTIT